MKRKGVDQVSEDFSDFSLSSPATKIRRLNAELPPIVEEDEPDVAFVLQQQQQQQSTTPIIEELPSPLDNQDKALVLFKPIHQHLLVSPSTFSFTVDSDIVSGIKNQLPWSRHSGSMPSEEEGVVCRDKNSDRLAVVPWAPSQFLPAEPNAHVSNTQPTEFMEAEQMEEASMDIETEQDNSNTITNSSVNQALHGELTETEGLHPWQQQHCLLPQLPQNTSTPISWTR